MTVVVLDVEIGVAADHQIRIHDAANAEADVLAEAVVEIVFRAHIEKENGFEVLLQRQETLDRRVAAIVVGADDGADLRLPQSGVAGMGGYAGKGKCQSGQRSRLPEMPGKT